MVLRGGSTPVAGVSGIPARSVTTSRDADQGSGVRQPPVQNPPTRVRLKSATVPTESAATVTAETAVHATTVTAGPWATRAAASEVQFVAPPVEVGVVASHASNEGVKGYQADDQAKDQK